MSNGDSRVTQEATNIVVVSDLHLAPERGRGLFQADRELADFFDWLAREIDPPLVVVIAGDLLDFLVPAHEGEAVSTFDPAGAPTRLRTILEHHEEIFDSLCHLASLPDVRLVILAGNHDAELALPEVQHQIENRLRSNGRIAPIRWLVYGEAIRYQVGSARVCIEHGDLFDDWNRIDHEKLRLAVSRLSRGVETHGFAAPPGSRLVVDFITPLRARHPWIDWLKPEREAVVPILHHFLPAREKTRLRKALKPWMQYLGTAFQSLKLRWKRPEEIVRGGERRGPREELRAWLQEEDQQLRRGRSPQDRQRLLERLRRVSSEDGTFDLEAPDHASGQLTRLVGDNTGLVIHGHTHAAKAYLLGQQSLYLNTGTWGNLLRLPGHGESLDTWENFLGRLEHNNIQSAPRFTFARLRQEESGRALAYLMEWRESRPNRLSLWSLQDGKQEWIQEA